MNGFFSKSTKRIGYASQLRSPLLTHAYHKPAGIHRAEEYVSLLKLHYDRNDIECNVKLKNIPCNDPHTLDMITSTSRPMVIFNIHSAASSRQIPLQKAINIGKQLIRDIDCTLVFTGSSRNTQTTHKVISAINYSDRCIDLTGKTTLRSLASVCELSDIVISSDSGTAHLANALAKPVVILFGAGNEHNTAPYNKEQRSIIRVPDIPCAPCVSNSCRYKHVNCMNNLDEKIIIMNTSSLLETAVC